MGTKTRKKDLFRRAIFPTRLKKAMEIRNITPDTLADAAGLTRETMCDYMESTQFPPEDVVSKLVMLLGTTEEWLFSKSDTVKFNRTNTTAHSQSVMLAYWAKRIDAQIISLPYENCQALAVLGSRMRSALKKQKMTQTELVEKLTEAGYTCIQKTTITKYCSGKELPPTELLLHIASALDKHPLWLIGGDEEKWPGDDAVFYTLPEAEVAHNMDFVQINNAIAAAGSLKDHKLLLASREDDAILRAYHGATAKEQNLILSILNLSASEMAANHTHESPLPDWTIAESCCTTKLPF